MISTSTGYKVIAIASLTYALFSCTAPVESQSNSEVLAKLEAIDAKIDALSSTLGQVYTAVQPNDAEIGACSIQEVIDQNFADCDPTRIPQDVAATRP